MAAIDVISWQSNKSELCRRYYSDTIKNGATLVVHEAQTAFFVKGGAIQYEFSTPGTHSLTTQNYPFLNAFRNIQYGGESPYKAEVWYVNHVAIPGLRWGTPTPIQLEDPVYKIIVPITAYGKYGIRVVDAKLFLESLIGNMSGLATSSVSEDFIKPYVIQGVSELLSKKISSGESHILNISNELGAMSAACLAYLNNYIAKYGIVMTDFSFMAITPTEDSLQRLSDAKMRAAEMKIVGEAARDMGGSNAYANNNQLWGALINDREVRGLTVSAIQGLILAKVLTANTMVKRLDSVNDGWHRISEVDVFAQVL